MSSKLKTSVLAMTLMGVLGAGIAVAQDAPATDTPEAQVQTETVEIAIPELLQGEAFADVESRTGRRGGLMVEGTIVETGKNFDAMVNSDGELVGMRTAEGSALPASVLEALLPEAVRGNAVLAEIDTVSAIGSRDGAVMAAGQDAEGEKVRIAFDAEGELVHFNRGDDRGGRGGHGMDDRGGKGPRGDRGGERGDHGHGGKHGDKGPRGDRGGDRGGERGGDRGGDRGPDAAPVDEAAVRSAVEGAGYTDLGDLSDARGRGIAIEAVNPQGEEVLVIVNPEGEVMRETAR